MATKLLPLKVDQMFATWRASLSRDPESVAFLDRAIQNARTFTPRRDLFPNHLDGGQALLIIDGWAIRHTLLLDGRRQITQLLVPGDVVTFDPVGAHGLPPLSALTNVTCTVIGADANAPEALRVWLAQRRDREMSGLHRQIARVGRMSAVERIVDLLLDVHERLLDAGLATPTELPFPLTQELMADCLGLTSVHINRMLQLLRRQNMIAAGGSKISLLDIHECRRLVGRP